MYICIYIYIFIMRLVVDNDVEALLLGVKSSDALVSFPRSTSSFFFIFIALEPGVD